MARRDQRLAALSQCVHLDQRGRVWRFVQMVGTQRGVFMLQLAQDASTDLLIASIFMLVVVMVSWLERRMRRVSQPGSRVPAPGHEHGQEQCKHKSDPKGLTEHLGL